MGAMDMAVGYPVHAVSTFRVTVTPNHVTLTDWWAVCGASGQKVGSGPLGTAHSARKAELCKGCWPEGHTTYHPTPVKLRS